jgi:hypothetical protein
MKAPEYSKKQRARRGLALYFTVLIPISIFLEWKIVQTGESIGKATVCWGIGVVDGDKRNHRCAICYPRRWKLQEIHTHASE